MLQVNYVLLALLIVPCLASNEETTPFTEAVTEVTDKKSLPISEIQRKLYASLLPPAVKDLRSVDLPPADYDTTESSETTEKDDLKTDNTLFYWSWLRPDPYYFRSWYVPYYTRTYYWYR